MAAVYIHPGPEKLALAAARLITQEACRSVDARGRFAIALAGGATPRRTYERLAGPPFVNLMPWESTYIFWTDERCVDPSDPRSNERMAREALLDHVPIPPDQIHPMGCGVGGTAVQYESLLRTFKGLDLVLLGLGEDGHTASLFPRSPLLQDEERWVMPVPTGAAGGGEEDISRMTLTAAFINTAAAVAFLVSGAAKAAAVRQVLGGHGDPMDLPARLICPAMGTLHWLLDQEAATLLFGPTEDRAG
ncbi:MAG: 6-phosphogluconolactonase [Thermoleophilia bacterium]|nr:6-phosphogluconolactonase [Thermoleophilia bacterium]